MSETDDKNYQPRRYRAEVKRAKNPYAEYERKAAEETKPEETKPAAEQETAQAEDQPVKEILDTSFDYVVPQETFEQHIRRKHHSSHTGKTKSASQEEMDEASNGYIFVPAKRGRFGSRRRRRRHKWRRLAPWKRFLIVITSVILILAITVSSTYLILHEIGRHGVHKYEEAVIVTPAADESGNEIVTVDNSGHVITYDGKSYELNEDIISVAFIGLDNGSSSEDDDLRMADAIYVLTIDAKTGRIVVLGVSRDTMADIDVYSSAGKFIDTERLQMAYSYANGNVMTSKAKNTTTALSRLFYGLPFENYFAIGVEDLIGLNDFIGGVTLNSLISFTSPVDGREIYEGDSITLYGRDAEFYISTRDTDQLESNNDRMQRQQQYIRAFLSTVIPAIKNDFYTLLVLNDEISVKADTNIDVSKLTYIASVALAHLNSSADIQYVNLTGEITAGEHAEMNVTDETIIKTMLDIFYKPYEGGPTNRK